MAISPSDISYALVVESTPGVIPEEPEFKVLDTVGGSSVYLTADSITSNTRKANRGRSGSRLTNFRVEGGLKTELVRDDALEILLQSALSGTWQTNVLKGGQTDTSFTIEKKMPKGSTTYYQRYYGCYVSDMSVNMNYGAMTEVDWTILGMGEDDTNGAIADASYAAASNKVKMADLDIQNITIAGLSGADFSSATLNVTNGRQALTALGQTHAIGVGTDSRTVELAVTMYMEDLSAYNLVAGGNNPPVSISLTIGTVDNGFTIELPKAQPSIPDVSEDGVALMTTVTFTAMVDETSGTDIKITRI